MSSKFSNVVVGGTGFLGSTLLQSGHYQHSVASSDPIEPLDAGTLIIAAPSATKWLANQDPELDFQRVSSLIRRLAEIRAKRVVLLSTVDVYVDPSSSWEESATLSELPRSYGANRRVLERFVLDSFEDSRSLRLSGLVGPGLKKNPIYDLKHEKNLGNLLGQNQMQFLPTKMVVDTLRSNWIFELSGPINLTAEPVTLQEAATIRGLILSSQEPSVIYDVYSRRLSAGASKTYFCSKSDSIEAIRTYFDS